MPGKLLVLKEKGFDLNASYGMEFKGKTTADIKALFSKTLKDGLHGLCFSPYVEGQETGDILSESQIRRRMDIIMPYTRWIRSFSCTEGNELIPKIAHDKGLKTLVGVWISNDRERNEREIKALVKLANEGLVDIAAVGNEVLLRNELPEQELIQYIKKVKALLPSHIPVGYVDAYFHFLEKPALADACDVILINCYPFWEGANNDHALLYMQHMYDLTKLVAQGKKIVITETGWPSKGQAVQEAQPSAENAMKYFINAQQWAKSENIELFYFSSFDESWKIYQEGVVGTQWGLWDKNEKQKYV
ncbi:MAG: glycosyl hydrolase [Saprospiraceae bacterium]|nr:glycosyl hydrolase [Saprospiraceae bacterium]